MPPDWLQLLGEPHLPHPAFAEKLKQLVGAYLACLRHGSGPRAAFRRVMASLMRSRCGAGQQIASRPHYTRIESSITTPSAKIRSQGIAPSTLTPSVAVKRQ